MNTPNPAAVKAIAVAFTFQAAFVTIFMLKPIVLVLPAPQEKVDFSHHYRSTTMLDH